jgi:two-component system cell cycle response regulator
MRYALIGGILGLGAPIGSLIWRVLIPGHGDVIPSILREWRQASYFYDYMAVGTVIAFGLFGYALGRRNENLSNLSITDGLTRIYNHRFLHEQLAHEIQRSDRYHTQLTCLMLDIDDFKKVNDQHGHPFGDEVLATTAKLIREAVRQIDLVGRYGGEEFLVIMPQTSSKAALPIAERILKAIQSYPFSAPEGVVQVTLSIGLATYPSPDLGVKSKNGLLSAADQALYKAKRTGKNQTVVWQP